MTAAKSYTTAATGDAAAMPKRVPGIMKVHSVSPALAEFLGTPEASRSGAIKKIWEYVKSQNLQVPKSPCSSFYISFTLCFYFFTLDLFPALGFSTKILCWYKQMREQ